MSTIKLMARSAFPAIIVSCLPSFRQLFVKRELSRQAPKPSADHSINSFLLGISSRLRCGFDGRQTHNAYQSKPLPSIPFKGSRYFRRFRIRFNSEQLRSHSQYSQISSESTVPLNGIHVGRDLRMTSTTYPAGAPKPHAELSTAADNSPVS
ncbi:hypothetical protein N7G274_008590 [Stereocaulon virgatum]|uniref:Uncharacterized protein n=1 Tax=Stereocaulon virgatum TaxID=373712 RepID=A0ABR4A5C0_9LECA